MSLYTPVFPPFHESNGPRKGPPEKTVAAAPGKQQNYVEFLRDVHLFLSTQGDMLSPPSRPNSPSSDRRMQKVRDEIQNVFNVTKGETSGGKWARLSQTLKLGCVRGRHWSVPGTDPCAPDEDTKWILPDEESEWIEWEKKREANRRSKQSTNVSQQIGSAASPAADPQKLNHASSAEPIRPYRVARGRLPPDVSPSTLRAAKEKVIKWQESVASSEVWHDTTSGSSPASTRAVVTANAAKGRIKGLQQSRTISFAVVKPAAKLIIDKRGKGSLSRPDLPGGSAPSRLSKSSTPSKPANAPEVTAPVDDDETGSKQPPKTLSVKDDTPRIADVSETLYLPPSFPVHLETSTPLPDSVMVVRAKPSPIPPLPALSSALLLPTSADPPDSRQLEPRIANVPPSLPSHIDTLLSGKRSRAPSASLDGIPNNPPLTPPPKKLRSLSRSRSTPSSKYSWPMSSNGGLDIVPCTRDNALDPSPSVAPGAPSTPRKDDQRVDAWSFPQKIPSTTKSIKSHFSAPDSDLADSPVKANLLLESPVSPMLSYAQNPSGFLPQITSTQVEKGSPAGRTTNGIFGIGYSSQFDVERHVDRVSELLEKDVDFDGWLRDVRTVETSQD